jgi:hypothetical protein
VGRTWRVGIVALTHSAVPVRDEALGWIRNGISGGIDLSITTSAVVGADHILRTVYEMGQQAVSERLENLLSASSID